MLSANSTDCPLTNTSAKVSRPGEDQLDALVRQQRGVGANDGAVLPDSLSIHCWSFSFSRKKGSAILPLAKRSVCTQPGTVAGSQGSGGSLRGVTR